MNTDPEARGASARALREYLTDPEHLLSVDQDGTRWAEVNVSEVLAILDALEAAEAEIASLGRGAALVQALVRAEEAEKRIGAARQLANGWANQPTDYDEDTEQQIEDGRMLLAVLDGRKRDHWEDS